MNTIAWIRRGLIWLALAAACLVWLQMGASSIVLALQTPITSPDQREGIAKLCGSWAFAGFLTAIQMGFVWGFVALKKHPLAQVAVAVSATAITFYPVSLLMTVV